MLDSRHVGKDLFSKRDEFNLVRVSPLGDVGRAVPRLMVDGGGQNFFSPTKKNDAYNNRSKNVYKDKLSYDENTKKKQNIKIVLKRNSSSFLPNKIISQTFKVNFSNQCSFDR